MIERILFPCDMSQGCEAMAPFVSQLAPRTNARVTFLNVFEIPPNYSAALSLQDLARSIHTRRDEFKAFLARRFDSLAWSQRIVLHGDPASVIVDFAKTHSVDLIMMPTHGLGIFRRMVIGSTTAKVLHDAECPVWTAAHLPEPSPRSPSGRIEKILCAVDLPDKSVATMDYTRRFAQIFGAQVRLLHVVPCTESFSVSALETEFVLDVKNRAAELLERQSRDIYGTADVVVRIGSLSHTIRQEAFDWHADLIIIGRGVLPHGLGRLRTQTYAIIRDAPCHVLSV